jgi:hypothetical protein
MEMRDIAGPPTGLRRLMRAIAVRRYILSDERPERDRTNEAKDEAKETREAREGSDAHKWSEIPTELTMAIAEADMELERISAHYFVDYLTGDVTPGLAALVRGLALVVPVSHYLVTVNSVVDALVEPAFRERVVGLCTSAAPASTVFGIRLPGLTDADALEVLELLQCDFVRRTFPAITGDDVSSAPKICDDLAEYSQISADHAMRVRAALVSAIVSRAQPIVTVV